MTPHGYNLPDGFVLDTHCLASYPLPLYFVEQAAKLGFGDTPDAAAKLAAFLLTTPYDIPLPPKNKKDDTETLIPWVPGHAYDNSYYGPLGHHEVMVIGKLPFDRETTLKRNFRSDAGQLFIQTCMEAGLDPRTWYMTNAVKFGVPGGDPDRAQVKVCIPLLMQEIFLVRPKFILMVGSDAVKAVLGDKATLGPIQSEPITINHSDLRQMRYSRMASPEALSDVSLGTLFGWTHFVGFATMHPAAVLREAGMRYALIRDLQTFKTVMESTFNTNYDLAARYRIEKVTDSTALAKIVDEVIASPSMELSIDCEWAGTDYMSGQLRTFQFAWGPNEACVAIFLHQGKRPAQNEIERIKMFGELRRLCKAKPWNFIGHAIRADAKWTQAEDIQILQLGHFWDTMLCDHMLAENVPHGLESVTVRHTDMGRYDFKMAEWLKHNKPDVEENGFANAPDAYLYDYAGCDVIAPWNIKQVQASLLNKPENKGVKACYNNVVLPCNLPLHEIETTGLLVDFELMKSMIWSYDTIKIELLTRLRTMLGDQEFNPNSVEQVRALLFNRTWEQLCSMWDRVVTTQEGLDAYEMVHWDRLFPADQEEQSLTKDLQQELLKPPDKRIAPKRFSFITPTYRLGLGLRPYKTTGKPARQWEDIADDPRAQKNAAPSTDAESLSELASDSPICAVIRDFKFISQVTKSFLRKPEEDGESPDDFTTGLAGAIDRDGRIRTSLSQTSETGRQKSADPNLQNLPKKTEKDLERIIDSFGMHLPHIRSCFVAPDGHVIIEADYKSAEVYTMGYLSNEPRLVSDADTDLHARGAVNYFGVPKWDGFDSGRNPPKEWKVEYGAMRVGAKTVNFGIPYQRGAKAIARQIVRETKGALQCTKQMAQGYIDGFYATYPGMREFVDMCQNCVITPPYHLSNPYGRCRRFAVSSDRSITAAMQREAVNFPIQSTVADTLNVAMINFFLWRQMWPGRAVYKILLAVHDAILLEVPGEYVGVVVEEVIPQCMTDCALIPSWQPVPQWSPTKQFKLKTDIEICTRWGEHPSPEDKEQVDRFANELRNRHVPDKWIDHFI